MKTITITIPEQLDAEAAVEARRRGISKSELIRQGLAAVLPPPASAEEDENLWVTLAGFAGPGVKVAPGEIDDIVYGL